VDLMSIRITEKSNGQGTVLQLDGRLASEDVDELMKAYRSAHEPVVLELKYLQSVSSYGIEALLDLASQGALLQGASMFVELLLKAGRGVD
jgi:anti-anti-sigma regulatory factor